MELCSETDVGEHLDEIRPPNSSLVDDVFPLATSVEASGDRQLREVERAAAVFVVEEELDLAESGCGTVAPACKEHVVGLFRPELGRAQAPCGPDDRVGNVRLAGAVR